MPLAHIPLSLYLSSLPFLATNQRSKSLPINPPTHKTITAKSHSFSSSFSSSSSSSSLSFNQTLGVRPLQPTNELPNNITRDVDGSEKGDKKKENNRRVFLLDVNPLCYNGNTPSLESFAYWVSLFFSQVTLKDPVVAIVGRMPLLSTCNEGYLITEDIPSASRQLTLPSVCAGAISWFAYAQVARASEGLKFDAVYEIGELFELGIQLSYLLLLLGLLGVGTFFVIRQVLVRRELDLSAKELQEQVRSGDASATELFELGAVMLRRKFYPAATKYLLQAIEKWDGDDQDLAQVHNALGVSYVRDDKLEKGIAQFESAVKLQPGYVTAWNNLGDAYEKSKDMKSALKAFEEVLLFDPNNKIARPRRDALKEKVQMYKGVALKTKQK